MILNNLILGTAQLNSCYGINNVKSIFNNKDAYDLLSSAKKYNIKMLDTALSYENAYEIIENFCNINSNAFSIIDKVDAKSVIDFAKLKRPIHWPWLNNFLKNGGNVCLMLHNGNDYLNPKIRKNLQRCRELNLVSSIGISIYETHELEKFVNIGGLDVIQLPLSLVNRKTSNIKLINKLQENNVLVHIRSIFLQGLLLSLPEKLPDKFQEYKKSFLEFSKIASTVEERIAFSIASVIRDISGSLIVGVDNIKQLEIILKSYKLAYEIPIVSLNKSRTIWKNMPDHIIDPRKWVINN